MTDFQILVLICLVSIGAGVGAIVKYLRKANEAREKEEIEKEFNSKRNRKV